MSDTGFIESIAEDIRYAPAIVGAFVFVLLLLFVDKLNPLAQQWLIPSVALYIMGAGIVGYIQSILYARNEQNLPCWQTGLIIAIHVFLWLLLLAYNCHRGVI